MTSAGVLDSANTANGSNNNNNKLHNKHEAVSDAATPETGDEENDHSTESEQQQHSAQSTPQSPAHPQTARTTTVVDALDGGGNGVTRKPSKARMEEMQEMRLDFDPSSDGMQLDSRFLVEPQEGSGRDGGDAGAGDPGAGGDEDDSQSDYSAKPDSKLWRARMYCGQLVNNEYVQITIICLIILNALLMGISTFDFVTEHTCKSTGDACIEDWFQRIDTVFLVIFTVEVTMQLFYLGVTLFADGWLVFDFLIVVFSWSFESLQIVRAFRIFRAFRLITRVKPLRDLVLAIGAVMPRMYAIAALLLLIFYIFSVLFTELFSALDLSDNYFTTLDASLFTCMEMMTLEWGEIAREVMESSSEEYEEYTWAWLPFSAFIMITGFIVFNLIVAVVCDAVAITEKTVRELDGFESDNPAHKLADAQERIDLLQCHLNDMLRTQENVQNMIELMAGELMYLEGERMRAENREAELRIEMKRRLEYERDMQSAQQVQSLERNYIIQKERRESERRLKELRRKASLEVEEADMMSSQSLHSKILPPPSIEKKKFQRRHSGSGSRSGFSRQGSSRSISQKGSRTNLSTVVDSQKGSGTLQRESSKGSLNSFDC